MRQRHGFRDRQGSVWGAMLLLALAGCDGSAVVGGPTADAAVDTGTLPATDVPTMDAPAMDTPTSDTPISDASAAETGVDAGPPLDVFSGCVVNDDCRGNEFGYRICNTATNQCVQCTPAFDGNCPPTQHCDGMTNTCVAGCRNDQGCLMASVGDAGVPARRCDTAANRCVECLRSADCPAGNVCADDRCVQGCDSQRPCAGGLSCCGGACVDTQVSASNCMGCGRACAAANATATCAMGMCGVGMCNSGYANCDMRADNGCETRVDSDIENCGACGQRCPSPAGATPACRAGVCVVGTCAGGFGDCDNSPDNGCETDTRTSPAHCGGCGMVCPAAPNAEPTCNGARCGFECRPGFGDCDMDPANGCETDLTTSTAHCGACGRGCAAPTNATAVCRMSRCAVGTCAAGFGDCDGSAENGCETTLATSASHCGACGTACPVGQVCSDGACGVPCPPGQLRCGGTCTQTDNDPANCGACGNRCPTGQFCGSGRCAMTCGTGQTQCSGACVTLATDNIHCGACGNRCADGFRCMSGTCRLSCPAGQTQCGSTCVDLLTDNSHCGRCGGTCSQAENCVAGTCQLQCPAPQVPCRGICVDLRRDAANCGACGTLCPTGCVSGSCASVVDVAATFHNNCLQYTSGRVFCWGLNNGINRSGGSFAHNVAPVQVVDGIGQPVDNITAMANAANHLCGLRTNGTVVCWGSGLAPTDVRMLPAGALVTQLAGRNTQFYGLLDDGRVAGWTTALNATLVAGITDAVEVTAGPNFGCARRQSGAVLCWGTNSSGQLGDGTTTARTTPVAVTGLTDAVALAAGEASMCALRMGGTVVCWGSNAQSQLGDGTTTNRLTPVAVTGLTGASQLRAGLRHVCALVTGGALRCWGDNRLGQLGDGSRTNRGAPVAVTGLSPQRAFSLYDHHTCGIGSDNRVRCWGYNPFGEAGGGTEAQSTPARITSLSGVIDLQQGGASNAATGAGRAYRCVLHRDGGVSCWGSAVFGNASGQLGNGTTTNNALPARVMGLTDATQISVAGNIACARRANATAVCWGINNYGQIGDNSTVNRTVPTAVAGLTNVAEVRTGGNHTCARHTNGTVSCWGYNFEGQLGQNDQVNRSAPVVVPGLSGVQQIEVGSNHTCARLSSGRVSCWGRNIEGQLADGSTTNRYVPGFVTTSASTLTTPVFLEQVDLLMCQGAWCISRQTGTGRGQAWGSGFGGIRSTSQTILATSLDYSNAGASTVCRVVAGTGSNTVTCQGYNEFGLVGNGMPSYLVGASPVVNSGAFVQVRGSSYAPVCAVDTTGNVFCWGWTADDNLLAAGITGITVTPAIITVP
jgi:Cys-rich repeat protein